MANSQYSLILISDNLLKMGLKSLNYKNDVPHSFFASRSLTLPHPAPSPPSSRSYSPPPQYYIVRIT